MNNRIEKILEIIEHQHKVNIIYACESGSRAWGFASRDSDYDVRFVYVGQEESYFNVFPKQNWHLDRNNSKVCENFLKYELDFVGWDIRKMLYQFSRGNPDMISWFFSPIQYRISQALPELVALGTRFFKSNAAYYHYMHMASKNFFQYIRNPAGNVRTKKYLYVLRPILACMWIEEYGSEPPMVFSKIYLDPKIYVKLATLGVFPKIASLLQEKRSGIEMGERPRIPELDKFCEDKLNYYQKVVKNSRDAVRTKDEQKALNKLFFNLAHNYKPRG